MQYEIRIPCTDIGEEDIVITYEDDGVTTRCADFAKLDADLKLIGEGKLNVALPEDTYDYTAHQWETPKGRLIGELFARVDAGEEF